MAVALVVTIFVLRSQAPVELDELERDTERAEAEAAYSEAA